jgi:hypothetical protein
MIKVTLSLFVITAMATIAAAEAPAPAASAPCIKSISFAMAENGQPVPAIPKFTAKWIGKKSHVDGYPELCLSQIPSASTSNYVVIFSTTGASFTGLSPSAHTYTSSGPASGTLAGISSYGGTWSYSYTGVVAPAPTNSVDLQRIDQSKKVLIVRAYDQSGRQVSDYSVDSSHSREKLLEQVMGDIHRDVAAKPSQVRVGAPLPVYYVNCDVDSPAQSSLTASADTSPVHSEAKLVTPPPPPPQPKLELSSNPSGSEIYLDGKLVGSTPLTVTVAPGGHVVMMRKKDFTTWTRTLQVSSGQRRVAAYLERQFLTISTGSQ